MSIALPSRKILLLGSAVPSWVLRAPDGTLPNVDIPYPLQKAWVKGVGVVPLTSLHSISRAANESYTNNAGVISSIGSNALAVGDAGLQVWEARTNLELQSQYNSGWGTVGGALVVAANAPDGSSTAATFTEDASNSAHQWFSTTKSAITSGSNYTASVFIKNGTRRYGTLFIHGNIGTADWIACTFDLQTGSITQTGSGASIATYVASSISALANGWFRVTLTGSLSSSSSAIADLAPSTSSAPSYGAATGNYSYTGDGSSTLISWGVQFELGAFASPYIPTTTGTVTRAADVITGTGALLNVPKNAASFWQYASFIIPSGGVTNQSVTSWSDGTLNNRIESFITAANTMSYRDVAGAVNTSPGNSGNSITFNVKSAFSRSASVGSDLVSLNGVSGTSSTPLSLPNSAFTQSNFGIFEAGNGWLNGNLRRLTISKGALTQAQLNTLSAVAL